MNELMSDTCQRELQFSCKWRCITKFTAWSQFSPR